MWLAHSGEVLYCNCHCVYNYLWFLFCCSRRWTPNPAVLGANSRGSEPPPAGAGHMWPMTPNQNTAGLLSALDATVTPRLRCRVLGRRHHTADGINTSTVYLSVSLLLFVYYHQYFSLSRHDHCNGSLEKWKSWKFGMTWRPKQQLGRISFSAYILDLIIITYT